MATHHTRRTNLADPTALELLRMMEQIVAQSRPGDTSAELRLARGMLAKICTGCGAELDATERRDPHKRCSACRSALIPPMA